ncbi:MAG TPA: hypothetical protein VLQ78_05335, partial [Ornithinibacter sp.]|nr:hypothetical protein [Ornithinibacter sp.]
NAAIREMWPHEEERSLHERLAAWIGELRRRRSHPEDRPAGWDDPFDGYGTSADDLGLSGLREAARGPLTPMSGAGRPAPPLPPAAPTGAAESGHRVDAER